MSTKTIFITGASTGIGKATAEYFSDRGWNVIATMRSPEKAGELASRKNVIIVACDVTKTESITEAVATALTTFQTVDVILNNAGYALTGAFEAMTDEQLEKQFTVNVHGLMAVTRAWLPHLRAHGGTIINVASMGGRLTFPFYSVYHATKWAVEGFSESLQFELAPHNVSVKIIEPGAIKTDFYGRSMEVVHKDSLTAYDDTLQKAMPRMNHAGETGAAPELVAKTIFRAATDGKKKLRYPVGRDAKAILLLRRFFPDAVYRKIVERQLIR